MVDEPHQSRCPLSQDYAFDERGLAQEPVTRWPDSGLLQVDDVLHFGVARERIELRCEAGCDLSGATTYLPIPSGQAIDSRGLTAICPAVFAAGPTNRNRS